MKHQILLIAILFLAVGCNLTKRAQRVANRQLRKIENLDYKTKKRGCDTCQEHYCEFTYPQKIGTGKTVYLPGKVTTVRDTDTAYVYIPGTIDTVVKVVTRTITNTAHDTIQRTDTFENTRAISLCKAENAGLRVENTNLFNEVKKEREARKEWQHKANNRLYMLIGSCVLSLALLFLIIGGMMGKISNPIGWLRKVN